MLSAARIPEITNYAQRLYERRGEGVLVKRVSVEFGDWKPATHYCHDNAATWVQHHPDYKVVHGCLYFDFVGALDFVRFTLHSVVETEGGELLDITPAGPALTYPFIRHVGSEDEFAALVRDIPDGNIDYSRPAEPPPFMRDLSHLLR